MAKTKHNARQPVRNAASLIESIDLQRRADRQLDEADFLAAEEARGIIFARLLVEHVVAMRKDALETQINGFIVAVNRIFSPTALPNPK